MAHYHKTIANTDNSKAIIGLKYIETFSCSLHFFNSRIAGILFGK